MNTDTIDRKTETSVGAATGETSSFQTGTVPSEKTALRRLIETCVESEWGLNHVAEQVQNRGVKLLLKAFAQQRAAAARELQPILQERIRDGSAPAGELQRGITDIAAAMTLGRENRQHVALSEQLDLERRLLEAYATALSAGLPDSIHAVVERQRNQAAAIYDRLEELDRGGQEHLVVRLFDQTREADVAVDELQRAGFDAGDYQVFEVEQLPVYQETPRTQGKSQRATIAAGALIGGIVGALIGLAVGLYQMLMPNPLEIGLDPVTMFISSALIGAAFGAIFGWIIGRNKIEDDVYLYEESLLHGERLVVVYANSAQVAEAERILRVQHERELGRA